VEGRSVEHLMRRDRRSTPQPASSDARIVDHPARIRRDVVGHVLGADGTAYVVYRAAWTSSWARAAGASGAARPTRAAPASDGEPRVLTLRRDALGRWRLAMDASFLQTGS
jgi:hypothetical protein